MCGNMAKQPASWRTQSRWGTAAVGQGPKDEKVQLKFWWEKIDGKTLHFSYLIACWSRAPLSLLQLCLVNNTLWIMHRRIMTRRLQQMYYRNPLPPPVCFCTATKWTNKHHVLNCFNLFSSPSLEKNRSQIFRRGTASKMVKHVNPCCKVAF